MAERLTNGRWAPGVSGNPGGRPAALEEVRALALEHTPAAIKRLAAIIGDEKSSDAAAVSAAREIIDRAVGRAEQSIHQKNTFPDAQPEDYMPDMDEMRRIMKGQKVGDSPARAAVGETDGEAEESDKVLN